MVTIEGKCPHCDQIRGFKIFALGDYSPKTKDEHGPVPGPKNTYATSPVDYAVYPGAAACLNCNEPVIAVLETSLKDRTRMAECISISAKIYDGKIPEVVRIIPEPKRPYSHPALPEKIRPLFVDMQNMLRQGLAPPLVVAGCRAILEEAVKELGGEGGNLAAKIHDLNKKAVVNGVLHEWAMGIKDLGNDAVHELAGAQADASELVEFTKLFLQYTFEFPSRVTELRSVSR